MKHIQVKQRTNPITNARTVKIICPAKYPGLTEKERKKMYEGIAMIADAYRAADRRTRK
jgi:hypothetical protein